MSRRYTPDEKAGILDDLRANHGDIALTHQQTGVPERTLREWKRDQLPPLLPPPNIVVRQQESPVDASDDTPTVSKSGAPTFSNDLEAMQFMRSRIMQELIHLTTSFNDDLGGTTPYHRVLILSRLLERLMKLDHHLKPYIPAEQVIRIVREKKPYLNPDFYKNWPPDQRDAVNAESPAAHNTDSSESQS